MSFDRADIRPAIDVYTKDNVYLGTVLAITPGPLPEGAPNLQTTRRPEGSIVSGELMGPMPTQTIGNVGPRTQAANTAYASSPDDATPLGQGSITVGKWYGLFGKRIFSLEAVQSVSLERIVLSFTNVELHMHKNRELL